MTSVLVLQHHPVETPGVFAEALAERGLLLEVVRPDLGHALPHRLEGHAAVIAMGGPMSVYDEERHPWLRDEDRLLKAAIASDLPTLGICLGSQLIAKAAGARVAPGPAKEIGWYPLTLTADGGRDPLLSQLPPTFEAFEWHGDVFDLPPGATSLARSERYPCQAFRLGRRTYGLLFHLEVTAAMVRAMADVFREEALAVGGAPCLVDLTRDLDRRTMTLNAHARAVFGAFLVAAGLGAR